MKKDYYRTYRFFIFLFGLIMVIAPAANKIIVEEGKKNSLQNQDEGALFDLDEHREIVEARKKIGSLINNHEWQKFVSQKTLQGYHKYLEAQQGPITKETTLRSDHVAHVDDLQGLLGLYDYMSKEWEAAQQRLKRIEGLLQSAITEKIANSSDMDFLISRLVLTREYDLSEENAQKFEDIIIKKIDRMRHHKAKFKKYSNHKLADNLAIKKVEAKGKIKLNDLSSFLEATVPERRKFLKVMKEAILKEHIQVAYNEKNKEKMKSLYVRRLKSKFSKREGKGCIGRHTYDVFVKELEKLDVEGLKIWHDGFEEEMAPREDFWLDVRSNLQGEGLRKMEKSMHALGLGKLKAKYEIIKKEEGARLSRDYYRALQSYKGENLFGQHTQDEFMAWFDEQDLQVQYGAQASLESWEAMGKYKALWGNIAQLDNEKQQFMKSKLAVWGHKEYKKQLEEFENADEQSQTAVNESSAALSRIKSSTLKSGAEDIQKNLEGRSGKDQDNFIRILEIQARLKNEPSKLEKVEQKTQNPEETMSREERMKSELEKTNDLKGKKAKVIELDDFKKIKTSEGENIKHVMVNQELGLKNLLQNFSGSEEEAKNTKLSISKSGQDTKDLGSDTMNLMLFLKAKRKEEREQKELKIDKTG